MERSGSSLEDGAEAFMLLLHGTLLVLWPSVLTTFDLNEVDVMLKNAKISRSVLSGEGGCADGWWCC